MIIAYAQKKDGSVEKRVLRHSRHPHGERRPDRHFSETLLRNYYAMECEQGSRFRSIYSKNQIKGVHETRLQLFDQTGRER